MKIEAEGDTAFVLWLDRQEMATLLDIALVAKDSIRKVEHPGKKSVRSFTNLLLKTIADVLPPPKEDIDG